MCRVSRLLLLSLAILLPCAGLWACDGGKIPVVGAIEGPAEIDEYSSVTYFIHPVTGTDVGYFWTVNPPSAGRFKNPDRAKTIFTAGTVTSDTPIQLRVVVSANEFEPVIKTRDVRIIDTSLLAVSDIDGPDALEENTSGEFGVSAEGDSGIVYEWQCSPPGAGLFESPASPATLFTAGEVNADTPVEIKAVVTSDNYGPVEKTKDIIIENIILPGWAVTWGGEGSDFPDCVATDGTGNIYVAGIFTSMTDFDPGPGIDEHTVQGEYDSFISKFDGEGNFLWARTWGGGRTPVNAIAVDSMGDVYIGGQFIGTVDFDPGPGVDSYTQEGTWGDGYVCKYDSSGNYQRVLVWGNSMQDVAYGLCTDGADDLYLCGTYYGAIDLDPGPGVDERAPIGFEDAFLSKFDPGGGQIWTLTWGGTNAHTNTRTAAYDGSAYIYITGALNKTVDLDPGAGVDEHTCQSYDGNAYLSKFDLDGDYMWGVNWGDTGNAWGMNVAAGSSGDVYVAGSFMYDADFDPGPGEDIYTSGFFDSPYICRYDSDGHYQWTRIWFNSEMGTDILSAHFMAVDSSGDLYTSGRFQDEVDLDTGPDTEMYTSNGASDIFLTRFDPLGNHLWMETWGGDGDDFAGDIALNARGEIFFVGTFTNEIDLDNGEGISEFISNGEEDAFLMKLLDNGLW